jgi:hypothetical protein
MTKINDRDFDLLPHEKKISDLYQQSQNTLEPNPSTQLDSVILAKAKQQALDNVEQAVSTKVKKRRGQWPISIAASVCLLSVLFITQQQNFTGVNDDLVNTRQSMPEPKMSRPDMGPLKEIESDLAKHDVNEYRKVQLQKAQAQQSERLIAKVQVSAARMKKSELNGLNFAADEISADIIHTETPELLASSGLSMLTLSEIDKLADSLRLVSMAEDNGKQNNHASVINQQLTLFEALQEYKKSHQEFIIGKKYLEVLTDAQVQQLKTLANQKSAVHDN